MKKLQLIGDSHLNQIWAAWQRLAKEFDPLTFGSSCNCVHGANFFEGEIIENGSGIKVYSNRVAEALPDHPAYVNSALSCVIEKPDDLYFFASPLHSAQIYRHPTWNSYCPWTCAAANPDLQALSDSVLEAWFESHLRFRLALIKKMKRHGYRVAVIEPPKPLARVPGMFALRRDIVVETDRLYRTYVAQRLRENDVPVISVPAHTHSGGLTSEAYSPATPTDPHHGNLLFGAEMMIRILEFAVDTIGTRQDYAALEKFKARTKNDLGPFFPPDGS